MNTNVQQKTMDSSNEVQPEKKKRHNCGLRTCFVALVDKKEVSLQMDVLKLILWKEMGIEMKLLDPELATILPYLMVYLIKHWSGWKLMKLFLIGKLSIKSWYEKFFKYLETELNATVNVTYNQALLKLNKVVCDNIKKMYESEELKDGAMQTDVLASSVKAPFKIHITGPPVLLNTIVFTESERGDIIVREFPIPPDNNFANMTIRSLLNYAFVKVQLECPVLCLSREICHDYYREISLVGTPLNYSNQKQRIQSIQLVNPNISKRNAYSLDYLKEYMTDLGAAMKSVCTNQQKIEEYEACIAEFLADVKSINVEMNGMKTFADNTIVSWNISKYMYYRNKKIQKTGIQFQVGYTEIVMPKAKVSLESIASNEAFEEYLNQLKSNVDGVAMPCLTFTCRYCDLKYDNSTSLLKHFENDHLREHALLCFQCKHTYSIFNLIEHRWSHFCVSRPKSRQL